MGVGWGGRWETPLGQSVLGGLGGNPRGGPGLPSRGRLAARAPGLAVRMNQSPGRAPFCPSPPPRGRPSHPRPFPLGTTPKADSVLSPRPDFSAEPEADLGQGTRGRLLRVALGTHAQESRAGEVAPPPPPPPAADALGGQGGLAGALSPRGHTRSPNLHLLSHQETAPPPGCPVSPQLGGRPVPRTQKVRRLQPGTPDVKFQAAGWAGQISGSWARLPPFQGWFS